MQGFARGLLAETWASVSLRENARGAQDTALEHPSRLVSETSGFYFLRLVCHRLRLSQPLKTLVSRPLVAVILGSVSST